ncbi:hypothetical protein [Streptomyces sp. NPDC051286]|uniref:nSTAND1 domain-containing NTPase n=1 Tax=Streptomyces sp. NPDC051286 TaxID=3365647 RepID=UPI0037BB9187
MAGLLRGSGTQQNGRAPSGVVTGLRARLLERTGPAGLVLFVDQLEEYAAGEPDAARHLFTLLVAVSGEGIPGAGSVRVIATARAESVEVLVTAETADLLSAATVFLAPLSGTALHRAITAPVDAVPALWFEPGLPERIVADAGNEPGRMTLVEFALTRLWERRTRSMLTHAAYDDLGGVAGALARYADDAFDAQVEPSEVPVAKRLFAQLVRPDDGGGFTRKPARVTDLAPELRALADRLVPTKLLVRGRTPDGEEIVDLAHEALTRLWQRLAVWLTPTAAFRAWQEEVRRRLDEWQQDHESTGGLLRDRPLAVAETWLKEQPEDITPAERRFIEASIARARYRVHLRQGAVALLAFLLLVAVSGVVAALKTNRDIQSHLRTQASQVLARTVELRNGQEPATALQLALAAWHTRPTDEAYGALLSQYVVGQYLVGSHPSGITQGMTGMGVSRDGRTIVVKASAEGSHHSTVTVLTGLLEGKPRERRLRGTPRDGFSGLLSADGTSYAAVTGDGTVLVWDLTRPDRLPGPRTLRAKGAEGRKVNGTKLSFTPDGRRLLCLLMYYEKITGPPARRDGTLAAWDVGTGRAVPVDPGLSREDQWGGAAFTADPDVVVLSGSSTGPDKDLVVLRELSTGREVRAFPKSDKLLYTVVREGTAVLQQPGTRRVRPKATDPAGETRVLGTGRSPSLVTSFRRELDSSVDSTCRYTVETLNTSDAGHYQDLRLTDLSTGAVHRTRLPDLAAELVGGGTADLAVLPRPGGGLTVIAPVTDGMVVARAEPANLPATDGVSDDDGATSALSPDGRRLARLSDTRSEVVDTFRGGSEVRKVAVDGSVPPLWTADGRWIVAWTGTGGLRAYRASGSGRGIELLLPGDRRGAPSTHVIDAVQPVKGTGIAVLTADGLLARFDAATGRMTGRPLTVGKRQRRPMDIFGATGQLAVRPGHPSEVAVLTRESIQEGEIQVWDSSSRKRRLLITSGTVERSTGA